MMGRKSHKAHVESKASSEHSGSLFQPVEGGRDVYGGWTKEGEKEEGSDGGGGRWGVLVGIAVPAAMGVTYLLHRQRNKQQDVQGAA